MADSSKILPVRALYADKVDLVEVDRGEGWTWVGCPEMALHMDYGRLISQTDCIIIATDGACRGNGTTNGRASLGVFFANGSDYNTSSLLNFPRATNQVAELMAGIVRLQKTLEIKETGATKLAKLLLKTDLEYLVKGMTEWIFKWERNGYKNAKDNPVTNTEFFQRLQALVLGLNKLDVEVLFWHVPRALNQEADALANAALEDNN